MCGRPSVVNGEFLSQLDKEIINEAGQGGYYNFGG